MWGTGFAGTTVNLTGMMFLVDVDVVNGPSRRPRAGTNYSSDASETIRCGVGNGLETKAGVLPMNLGIG